MLEPVLETFLSAKGALSLFNDLTEAIRKSALSWFSNPLTGPHYSSNRVKNLVASRFAEAFGEFGILPAVSKLGVNDGLQGKPSPTAHPSPHPNPNPHPPNPNTHPDPSPRADPHPNARLLSMPRLNPDPNSRPRPHPHPHPHLSPLTSHLSPLTLTLSIMRAWQACLTASSCGWN